MAMPLRGRFPGLDAKLSRDFRNSLLSFMGWLV